MRVGAGRALGIGAVVLLVVTSTLTASTPISDAPDPQPEGATGLTDIRGAVTALDANQSGAATRPGNTTFGPSVDPNVTWGGGSAASLTADRRGGYTVIAAANHSLNITALERYGTVGTVAAGRAELRTRWSALSALRNRSWVGAIRPQMTATSPQVGNDTRRITDFRALTADRLHAKNITGEGVTVGVIGVAGYRTSDAPYSDQIAATRNFASYPFEESPAHDTAATEQLAETAPNADLYLTLIETETDYAAAIDWLLRNDVDVVLTEVGFSATAPDGSGFVAQQTERASRAGMTVVSAAGNYRHAHYEGRYSDPDGDGLHNFDGELEGNPIAGPQKVVSGRFTYWLTWSDFDEASVSDYSLYLYNPRTEEVVARSRRPDPQSPREVLQYQTSTFEPLQLVVEHVGGDRDDTIQIIDPNAALPLGFTTPQGSVVPPASARSAIGVGAYNLTSGHPPFYSSEGPINGHNGIDVVSPTNLPASTYERGFTGTSGAAPYVAGTAALMHGINGSLTPAETAGIMRSTARPLSGRRTLVGAGLINATAAVHRVRPPNQPPTASAGPNRSVTAGTSVTLNGSGSTDPDGDPLTYSWARTDGPSVTLRDADTATPEFTAPAVQRETTLTFRLTVGDGRGGFDTDTVQVTVRPRDDDGDAVQLRLSTADVPTAVTPGGTFTVTYRLENAGSGDAGSGGVQLLRPSAGVSIRSFSTAAPDSFRLNGSAGRGIAFSTVEAGETKNVTVTYEVADDATAGSAEISVTGFLRDGDVERNRTVSRTVQITEDGLSRFDTNENTRIDFTEVLATIAAFNEGTRIGGARVSFTDVLEVIQAFNT